VQHAHKLHREHVIEHGNDGAAIDAFAYNALTISHSCSGALTKYFQIKVKGTHADGFSKIGAAKLTKYSVATLRYRAAAARHGYCGAPCVSSAHATALT
jgi:hypothetical protein